jgi:hypothetical protein
VSVLRNSACLKAAGLSDGHIKAFLLFNVYYTTTLIHNRRRGAHLAHAHAMISFRSFNHNQPTFLTREAPKPWFALSIDVNLFCWTWHPTTWVVRAADSLNGSSWV